MAGLIYPWGQFPWGLAPWGGVQLTTSQSIHVSTLELSIISGRPVEEIASQFETPGGKHEIVQRLQNYISSLQTGSELAVAPGIPPSISFAIQQNETQAFATFTLTNVVAGDEITINAVPFTAVASGPGPDEFVAALTDEQTAINLSNAINESVSALIDGYVTAIPDSNAVTVISTFFGLAGNQVPITTNSVNTVISADYLEFGTADPNAQILTF